jgi:hypothetical protein
MGFYMRVEGRLKGSLLLGLNIPTNACERHQRFTVCFTTIYFLERVESTYSWGGRFAKGTRILGGP